MLLEAFHYLCASNYWAANDHSEQRDPFFWQKGIIR